MADGSLLSSSTPVFRVDDAREGGLARDLVRLEIDEDTAGMKRLAARFTAWGPSVRDGEEGELWFDRAVIDFGKRLAVAIGATGADRTIFEGVISALESDQREGREPELVVFAEDDLMRLRLKRRFKTYADVTDADIVRAIAADHGLTPDIDADGPTHPVVQQWNLSDLAFLRERARLLQADLWALEGKLGFKTRDKRDGAELTLVLGGNLLLLEARADLAHQRSEATVSGYDIDERGAIDETADASIAAAEAGDGQKGAELLEQAFDTAMTFRAREAPASPDAAQAWARAELLRRARRFVTLKGVTSGSPELMVGGRISLQRVAKPFLGGGYYVTRVTHTYDRLDGHRTAFEAERATVAP
jgi:phage protein D